MTDIVAYALLWLSFAIVHSALTFFSVKSRLAPVFGSAYRLSYNLFSALHIGAVFLLGKWLLSDHGHTFALADSIRVLLQVLTWGGVIVMAISLRQYDLGRFSGLSQLRKDYQETDHEPLNTKGMNRWVRHPLYTGAFMYLWGNAQSSFGFWTAVFASIYLIIGARYEERKLVDMYGDDYRRYKANVPAFFPWRYRQITSD